MNYVLPLVFSLGLLAVGTGLLVKVYRTQAVIVDPDHLSWMLLKGAGLAIVGLAMLVVIIWKSGLFGRRRR